MECWVVTYTALDQDLWEYEHQERFSTQDKAMQYASRLDDELQSDFRIEKVLPFTQTDEEIPF